MRDHRVLAFAGAGSALAATIVIVATLLVPTPGTTVGAATIFASLHEAVNNAFKASYHDVGLPALSGVKADAEVVVVLDGRRDHPSGSQRRLAAVYFEGRVTADHDAGALAHLDYEAAGAFTEQGKWIYVKVNQFPQTLVEKDPHAVPYQDMYRNGLLLDLDLLIEVIEGIEELDREPATTAGVTSEVPSAEIEGHRRVIRLLRRVSGLLSRGMAVRFSTDDGANELLTSMLVGQVSPEDFERLVTSVEVRAGQVGVTTQADGAYLLRATDFNFDDTPWGPFIARLCHRMTLEIAYEKNAGLLQATAAHLGPYDGTIRLEPAQVTAGDPMFSDQRYRDDGVTSILDRSIIRSMLKGPGA